MSLREKFAGNTGGTRSDYGGAASKASRMYAHLSPSGASTAKSSKSENRVTDVQSLGDKASMMGMSSHNDINRFTSGISMHHPYKERGGAFGSTAKQWQANPDGRSDFATPSGGNKSRASRPMGSTQKPKPDDDIMTEK